MRRSCPVLVLGAWLSMVTPAIPASLPTAAALEGDWETFIASPRRPWIFVTHFERVGGAWGGTMIVRGLGDFPLSDVRSDSARVRLRFPPELGSLAFDGTLSGAEINGYVAGRGQPIAARFRRIVPLPAPANRAEAWRQDLDFAATHLADYDRSFSPAAREEFIRALGRIKSEVDRRNDAQIVVALSRAVALAQNAHTRLRLDPTRQGTFSTEFPFRVWWFSDGPHLVKAAPEYQRALRCRVVAVDGHEMPEVRRELARLFAGNAAWADYMSAIYLVSPDVLFGLGLIATNTAASFTFEEANGSRFTLTVRARPLDKSAVPSESWQDLSPLLATGSPTWRSALPADAKRVPRYLRNLERAYWFDFVPESGLLYFQFNRSDDDAVGASFQEFGDSLLAYARQHPVRDVVVDLRFNSGGNLDVARDFIRSLGDESGINRVGHLFVVVGHCTFSAGLYHAAQLKQFTRATFVGEAVGDDLDYWAEGGEVVLPNSQAVISYSNGFHRYSEKDYAERRPYYEELHITNLAPDLPAPMSSRDYFSGRDPALEVIEAHKQ
jgi:hypothetical protein